MDKPTTAIQPSSDNNTSFSITKARLEKTQKKFTNLQAKRHPAIGLYEGFQVYLYGGFEVRAGPLSVYTGCFESKRELPDLYGGLPGLYGGLQFYLYRGFQVRTGPLSVYRGCSESKRGLP